MFIFIHKSGSIALPRQVRNCCHSLPEFNFHLLGFRPFCRPSTNMLVETLTWLCVKNRYPNWVALVNEQIQLQPAFQFLVYLLTHTQIVNGLGGLGCCWVSVGRYNALSELPESAKASLAKRSPALAGSISADFWFKARSVPPSWGEKRAK